MARRRRPPPPDDTPAPKVAIPESSFPYIMDLIFQAADHNTLLVLRTMNRDCRERADAILLRHIVIKGQKNMFEPRLDRLGYQFFEVDGCRARIRPFQAMLSRQDMTVWADRVHRWSKKETGLKHAQVVDIVHTLRDVYGFELPSLKTIRVHHTRDVQLHEQLRFTIYRLPPTTEQVVTFGHHFPVNLPRKGQHWFSSVDDPHFTHSIDSVIINILPGGFSNPLLHTNEYMDWENVSNVRVVLSPDFCRRQDEDRFNWLDPWSLFACELRSLLVKAAMDKKTTGSLTLVGVADAWFKTTDCMKLGRDLRRVMDPQDVLCPGFWYANGDIMLQKIHDLVSLGSLIRVVEDYKITVLSLDQYRATRTPAEFEVETVPNAFLLAASEAAEIEDYY
ncbi:uncharacterized protein LOC62_03G003900 [Vanrija pseudolonga]|uniref:Uncharacterized protein n=1 Tax=Vanrija pseudolonga TaxID=143232 RepID=A0AAF1BGX9_9TREE|nr:hypothetical protein LOC62_03G003900 [Vanrija pseudolonga]